jgi:hypothetical protein
MAFRGSLRIDDGISDTISENLGAWFPGSPAKPGKAYSDREERLERIARQGERNGGRIGPRRPRKGSYPQNLAKLFPAEGATAFPLFMAVAEDQRWLRVLFTLLIAVFVILYRYLGTQRTGGGRPDRAAIFVSTVSFLLFAASLGGFGVVIENAERTAMLGSALSLLWLGIVSELAVKRGLAPTAPRKPLGRDATLAERLADEEARTRADPAAPTGA